MLGFQFKAGTKRAEKSNAIDLYVTNQISDRAQWESCFEVVPPVFTADMQKEWKATMSGIVVSSDAFFPFPDNVDRVAQSGVSVIAAPSGSVMDEVVIKTAESKNIHVVFTSHRLFTH